ncbi:MAG: hypothetical protein D4R73_08875, partial [Deltaproteobacteria bacterium]
GIDKGFRYPNVTLCIQPDLKWVKWERVIVFFAHYQVLRTPEKNAKIALEIHKARSYGQLTGGWGLLADASDSKTRIGENLAAFEENERVALEKFAKANPNSTVAVAYLNAARDARKEIKAASARGRTDGQGRRESKYNRHTHGEPSGQTCALRRLKIDQRNMRKKMTGHGFSQSCKNG